MLLQTVESFRKCVCITGCKAVGVAISDALHQADLSLSRGHLVDLRFDRAVASREEAGTLRRLDLRFVARVDDGI